MSNWISVNDRLPDMYCNVFWWESKLVRTYGEEGPRLARLRRFDDAYEHPEWIGQDGGKHYGVTHWQPITQPEEEDGI